MKEDFLHYLWDAGKIPFGAMRTTGDLPVMLVDKGLHNSNAGPDFLNATLYIGETLWAGHVEMHLDSSSWYAHEHHLDPAYRNVVLHVVWRHDREVYLADGSLLPVLELQGEIPRHFLEKYHSLSGMQARFLNCSGQLQDYPLVQWHSWFARLFVSRMEHRTAAMYRLDPALRTHWEALLFRAVFRYMGAQVNADAFYSIAETLGIEQVRKIVAAGEDLEVVLHGLAGFFEAPDTGADVPERKREYHYLCNKYRLVPERVVRPVFFRLRPAGFPTIRLSQLARIYGDRHGLFARLLLCDTPSAMRSVFEVSASPYWDTRYTYTSKGHKARSKRLSRERIDLLLLNAVLPILYAYYKYRGSDKMYRVVEWASAMPAENNKILFALKDEGVPVGNAAHAQGALELYSNYCSKNKCLQCEVGQFIIGG